ncbi:hypothetical protein DCCM_3709 [Desulfocucumis palustris]|uniref:Uncharacterized protein n=1 Tax=Desulfocucumis palustris TaxID=1898651 RepID=A0A2L2XEK6_9FIRM|nr:hypothetical protein [Desulfocucumis palustris]GBF34590.1 hypothetical protein DCCM_3709 [Desulfocucumis palustris]
MPFLLPAYSIGLCKIKIELKNPYETVITVIQDNIGKGSITNNFEFIATNVAKLFFEELGILPGYVKWVELYPAGIAGKEELKGTVTMLWEAGKQRYSNPQWERRPD